MTWWASQLTLLRTLEPVVYRACQSRFKPSQRAIGCSLLTLTIPSKCTIYIVTDEELNKYGWDYDIILRHELGHCLTAGSIHTEYEPCAAGTG
jgi:hypothetical protein